MGKKSLERKKMLFVEDLSLLFQAVGLPHMAGRIYGWLLICHPPHQSATQLAEVLGGSKGSISTMTRLLMQLGLIERMGLPGHRRFYYHIKPGCWSEMLRKQLDQVRAMRRMAERGLALMKNDSPARRVRLHEMRDIHAFFERQMPTLMKRWEWDQARSK